MKNLQNMPKKLILIGPPGSGKTTIGKRLAEKLSQPFWDTDDLLEDHHQKTLGEIIADHDEKGFAEIEASFISNLSLNEGIISTGGSVGLDKKLVMSLSKGSSLVIFMNASPQIVVSRIGTKKERIERVLGAKSLGLESVVKNRESKYTNGADIIFDINALGEPIDQTITRLEDKIKNYLSK